MFRLALPPRVWQRDFPNLARAGQRGVAEVARFELRAGHEKTGLVAGNLNPLAPGSSGRQFGIYDQLLIVAFSSRIEADSADRLLAEFSPGHSQLVVSLVLGIEGAAGLCSARVYKYGETHELGEFDLVGPGMRSISRSPPVIQPAADQRWSRTQGALGEEVFQRVRASQVALIGNSRNGSVAGYAFTMLGVERLILIDPDREENHNLSATLGAAPEGVGDWKVQNRASSLRRMRPDDLAIETLNRPFPDRAVEDRLGDVDLICTCVDGDLPRLAAATWCNQHCVPHLDIGSGVFRGEQIDRQPSASSRLMGADIRLCLPGEACVACLGGLHDIDEARRLLRSPPGVLPRARRREWHEARAGSLPTVNSVAVNLGVQLWLDLLAGRVTGSRWMHVEWQDDGLPRVEVRATPAAECSICRASPIGGTRESR